MDMVILLTYTVYFYNQVVFSLSLYFKLNVTLHALCNNLYGKLIVALYNFADQTV